MGEHRSLAGDETRRRRIEQRMANDIGRHQVGSELDAPRLAAEGARQRLDQQGLAEPGHALDQDVGIGQQGDQHFVDHCLLADHRLGHFATQGSQQLLCLMQFFCGKGGGGRIHEEAFREDVPARAVRAEHR